MHKCVEWHKARSGSGYGQTYRGNRAVGAHREAYRKAHGDIPPGMFVLHRCDNKVCVNPDHLFLGTAADNARDKTEKGRQARGATNGMAAIQEQTAVRIKMLRGALSPVKLAQALPVGRSEVHNIMAGISWKHVTATTRYRL